MTSLAISMKNEDIVSGYGYIHGVSVPVVLCQLIAKYISMPFEESVILKQSESGLKRWLANRINSKFNRVFKKIELIYQGSRDGFTASDFHRKCDYRGPTVSLFKSNEGHVFGGFTKVSWTSPTEEMFRKDPDSFLFLLNGNESILNKYGLKNELPMCFPIKKSEIESATHHYFDYGPGFGKEDFVIFEKTCLSFFPEAFSHETDDWSTILLDDLLGGAVEFILIEIETWQIQSK